MPSTSVYSSTTQILPIVRLHLFEHRGGRMIGLRFPADEKITMHLRQSDIIHWSELQQCYCVAAEKEAFHALKRHCRGVLWLQIADLYKQQAQSRGTTQLSQDVLDHIGAYEVWLKQKRYSPSTIRTYLSFVRQFFARHPDLAWDAITLSLIREYNHSEFIEKGKSYSAQNQWINAIKLYLRVHELDVGALSEVERPKTVHYLPDVLSPSEVQQVIQSTTNVKHRTLLMLIYSCGLRIGEALNLCVADIQSTEQLIYIRSGKGKKDRRVPLSPRLLSQLRSYYKTYRPRHYLFDGQQKGRKYSSRSAANVLKRAVAKTDIKKRVTLHTLRHSYATHITQRGVGLRYVQEILGHKSPKTTMIYTHLSGKDIRTVRSPLDDLDL